MKITCPSCKDVLENKLIISCLLETATLVCPTDGTEIELTAHVKDTEVGDEDEEDGDDLEADEGPIPPRSNELAAIKGTGDTMEPEMAGESVASIRKWAAGALEKAQSGASIKEVINTLGNTAL